MRVRCNRNATPPSPSWAVKPGKNVVIRDPAGLGNLGKNVVIRAPAGLGNLGKNVVIRAPARLGNLGKNVVIFTLLKEWAFHYHKSANKYSLSQYGKLVANFRLMKQLVASYVRMNRAL